MIWLAQMRIWKMTNWRMAVSSGTLQYRQNVRVRARRGARIVNRATGGKYPPIAIEAIGRAIAKTDLDSEHGQLLAGLIRALAYGKPLDDVMAAAWQLAIRGETPTAKAVGSRLEVMHHELVP